MSVSTVRGMSAEEMEGFVDYVIENKDQRADWDDDVMAEALWDLHENTTYDEIEEEYDDVTRSQVNAQVQRADEFMEERMSDDASSDGDTEAESRETIDAPAGGFSSPADVARDRFEDFLDEMDEYVGLKDRFVKMALYEVENTGQLPTPNELSATLDSSKSGVGNKQELNWLVRQYQNWLSNLQQEVTPGVAEQIIPSGMVDSQMPHQQGFGWGQQGQAQQSPGGFGMQQGPYTNQQQPPQQGAHQGQQNPMVQQLAQQVEELRQQNEQLQRELRDNGDNGSASELDEIIEMQEKLEKLQGGDEDGEMQQALTALSQQMQQVQQQLQNDSQDVSGQGLQGLIMQYAQDEDKDIEELVDIVDEVGFASNEEVQQKRIEKKMKEMELDHSKKRGEQMANALQKGIEEFGTIIGSALKERGGGEGQESQQAQQQQPQQPGNGQQQQQQQGNQAPPAGPSGIGNDTTTGDYGVSGVGDVSNTTPSGNGGGNMEVTDGSGDQDGPETMECPECGTTSEVGDEMPGFACPECGYSVRPCASCQAPVEIPPPGEIDTFGCPQCGDTIEREEGAEALDCPSCEWEGTPEDSGGEVVSCDNCGELYNVGRMDVEV